MHLVSLCIKPFISIKYATLIIGHPTVRHPERTHLLERQPTALLPAIMHRLWCAAAARYMAICLHTNSECV